MARLDDLVTGVLVTLNESNNVEDCILFTRAAGVKRIILVDASSTDDTVQKAKALGADCFIVPKKGLAFQRQFGVDLVRTPYVLLVDADNRLDPDAVTQLLEYLGTTDFVGAAAQKVALANESYWARGIEWNNFNSLYTPGPKKVVGTPALYKTSVLQQIRYDTSIRTSCDDTDLCFRLAEAGLAVAAGPGICREVMRDTFAGFVKKIFWYGKGDAEFFLRHPERRLSIALHALRNYFFKGQICALLAGRPDLMPFFAVYGTVRWMGFWIGLSQSFRRHGVSVYKT